MSTLPLTVSSKRAVLEGVPRIQFFEGGPQCPEDVCLPSVMRALTQYLDDDLFACKHCLQPRTNAPLTCSYAFFMGISGAASFLSWKKGWIEDNMALFYMSADPEAPERNCLKAIGYAYEWVEKQEGRDNLPIFRERIVESIQRGMPVLGYGIIGPPEPCLITGYDEGGDVLIGWNFFQKDPAFAAGLEFEPDGQFRKRDWLQDTFCLLVVGEKYERPPLKQTYYDALEWALKVTRTPIVRPEADAPEIYRERANGLAAYDAWAEHLLRDEDFDTLDQAVLQQRHRVHDFMVGMLAEWRWYGSLFLAQAANPDVLHHDMVEDLLHAAGCYAAEHALMWRAWDLAGGNGNPEGWRLLVKPAVRRAIAPIILEARDQDARAADHIERALSFYR